MRCKFFTAVPTVGSVAEERPACGQKLLVQHPVSPQGREQYRQLSATLYDAQLRRGIKVLSVTSAAPGEGKTFTAANLACTLSDQHRRVLLIDADLRFPAVHEVFGIPSGQGLAAGLSADGPVTLVQAASGLWLLTAGQANGEPLETLTANGMRALIQEARAMFDWVLLDTPPVGLVSDAKVLASIADATILVVLAQITPYDLVQKVIETLRPAPILGVVLNGVSEAALPYRGNHPYYAGAV